ncbi:uncharacterized protein LOC108054037 [Drosophila rhopaloa]|uniref:Uncharacterized protein LOC108054037 n=1 Tax=Drosophila rhopaloa TaxID=1041015 RepID=A0A6P4DXK5_DRORH|nr:uncharacterized protein LOC108054037 [Drosophila rhopaloa]
MKAALVLLCLALFMALCVAVYGCNPDGNNKPDCTNSTNVQVKIRNFWDPTRYWWCASLGSQDPVVKTCESETESTEETTGFDPTTKSCIPWGQWKWVDPCA